MSKVRYATKITISTEYAAGVTTIIRHAYWLLNKASSTASPDGSFHPFIVLCASLVSWTCCGKGSWSGWPGEKDCRTQDEGRSC